MTETPLEFATVTEFAALIRAGAQPAGSGTSAHEARLAILRLVCATPPLSVAGH